MAVRAAQTGHLVLATLHTNSAPEAITRLCHMGIEPFHLVNALTVVTAQRLARRLCAQCKTVSRSNQNILCLQCNDGYYGRIGIFELMPITNMIKNYILEKKS